MKRPPLLVKGIYITSFDEILSRRETFQTKKCFVILKKKNSFRYASLNVVCPRALHTGDFTVGAVDNIDHDTSSYTAKTSFHGTAMSLMQFPDFNAPGRKCINQCIEHSHACS